MRPNFSIGIIARIMGNPRSMLGSAPSENWTARIGIFRPSPSGCDGRPIGDTNLVLSVTTQFSTPASSNWIIDEGPLPPFADMSNVQNMHDLPFLKPKYDMTTFDEVLVKASSDFHGQGQEGRQAVLCMAQHHAHARLDLP